MIRREAARALVLTPDDELLLIQTIVPPSGPTLWIPPGGGIERGETPYECLRRELFEETGLAQFDLGPLVWLREHASVWDGKPFHVHEGFYVVRVPRFEPTARSIPQARELGTFGGFRWWQIADIERSTELFVPRRLGTWLRALLMNGPPANPVDVGE